MKTAITIFLILHIASGFSALVSGLVAIITKKGHKPHRIAGKIYVVCMLLVAITAIFISVAKQNSFLLHIAIFSFLMTYSGYRAVTKKLAPPTFTDWLVVTIGMANGVFMIVSSNLVLIVFGVVLISLALGDVKLFISLARQKEINSFQWLARHISMMMGSYIATTTAFLVVNAHTNPAWVLWLAPTFIGTPLIFYWINKRRKAHFKKVVGVLIVVFVSMAAAKAQPYVDGGKTRHRFAQLNIGVDTRVFPSFGSQSAKLNDVGGLEKYELETQAETRLIIGGTHFWGHADFFVAIPIYALNKSGFLPSIETGAKIYPWRIQHNKIRPYLGTSFWVTSYKQGNGTTLTRFKAPLLAGLTYNRRNHLIDVGIGYNYDNSFSYYISQSVATNVKTPPILFSVGYKWMLETTLSAEKDWQSGSTKLLTDTLAKLGRLDGFTIALGPSSAFFLKKSSHIASIAPFADDHKAAFVPIDAGIGYYFHKPDVQFNLAYRSYKSTLEAYGYSQTAKRASLALEAYKFLMDYHGFAAFIGPALSYEWLTVKEPTETNKYEGIKPGITFGWDIRPNRLQGIVLRTSLRYFSNLSVSMPNGKNVAFDGLEFNFIQVVIYPKRLF